MHSPKNRWAIDDSYCLDDLEEFAEIEELNFDDSDEHTLDLDDMPGDW